MKRDIIDRYRYNTEDVNDVISFVYQSDFDTIKIMDGFNTSDNVLTCVSVLTDIEIIRKNGSDRSLNEEFIGLNNEQEYVGYINIKITSATNQKEIHANGKINIDCKWKDDKLKINFDGGFSFERPVLLMVNPEIVLSFVKGYLSKYWRHIMMNHFDRELWNMINTGGAALVSEINKINK